jgi:hypothetical protein
MIRAIAEDGDAADFIACVDGVLRGIVSGYAPPELILVKIGNWFGPNWLRFSGKTLGALGVWKRNLTVPPFVPNRVVRQRRFASPSYEEVPSDPQIHVSASGEEALARRLAQVAPGAALVWFSGASEPNRRGAIMAYVPVPDSYWVWYAGFSSNGEWHPSELKEITARELSALTEA